MVFDYLINAKVMFIQRAHFILTTCYLSIAPLRMTLDHLLFCFFSYIYEASTIVMNIITLLEEQRSSLLQLQEKHGVKVISWYLLEYMCVLIRSCIELYTATVYRSLAAWIANFQAWLKLGLLA